MGDVDLQLEGDDELEQMIIEEKKKETMKNLMQEDAMIDLAELSQGSEDEEAETEADADADKLGAQLAGVNHAKPNAMQMHLMFGNQESKPDHNRQITIESETGK